jgi:hypothetical protein
LPAPLSARLRGALLRTVGWQPRLELDRTRALWRAASAQPLPTLVDVPGSGQPTLAEALAELQRNLRTLEWCAATHGRPPAAMLGWVWRQYQLILRVARSQAPGGPARAPALAAAPHGLVPLMPPRAVPGDPALGVDAVIEAARRETRTLGRKRRLLEAARRLLLDADAALSLDAEAVALRRRFLTRALARLDRLQAAGVDPDVAVRFQVQQARNRGEVGRLHAALVTLEEFSADAGDFSTATGAGRALDRLWQGREGFEGDRSSLARSARELLGDDVCGLVEDAYQAGQHQPADLRVKLGAHFDDERAAAARRYLAAGGAAAGLAAAIAADGCFEVGHAAAPVRAKEVNRRWVEVRHPTQTLALVPATDVSDLPSAVIEDPRSVLFSLAEGRLLARRYMAEETTTKVRRVPPAEIRIYLLDGSGSMIGPRARMRDGLLVSELATLAQRLDDPDRQVRPSLYYRYFDLVAGDTRRVTTREDARAAIAEVAATIRVGGTDIQGALIDSFAQIRAARASDPELARAHIVLVTDGEAAVHEASVHAAREAVRDIPIGVSIVALGEENAALRALAATQRARGERVFYQFMDDFELQLIESGATAGLPIHLPVDLETSLTPEALDALTPPGGRPDAAALDEAHALAEGLAEVGLGGTEITELAALRKEAAERDAAAVSRRFARWIPAAGAAGASGAVAAADRADADSVHAALVTVAEVIDDASTVAPAERQADAVEILMHVLLEAGVPPWRYEELVRRYPARFAPALGAVWKAARCAAPAPAREAAASRHR